MHFYLLKRRLKGEPLVTNKLKEVAVKAWKSITTKECKVLVVSVGCRLDADVASKGSAIEILFSLIYFKFTCSYTFAHLKMWCPVSNDATF